MSSTKSSPTECLSDFSKIDECTISLSGSLALRVYSDTKPHNWKIADLQKGLILVYKGTELIEEGTGFGVPILLYSDETYFSGSSNLYLSRQNDSKLIYKEFVMDMVPRKKLRKVELTNPKLLALSRYIAELYQRHRHLRPLMSTSLSKWIGLHTSFAKTVPAGKVIVAYSISQDRVLVKTDFSLVRRENLQKIFVSNEQGSRFFTRYTDSEGTTLVDSHIGAWDRVEAEWASITDTQGRVGFRLRSIGNGILRRGREFLKGYLDWVGLDYEINPVSDFFEYEIEILGS